MIRVFGVLLFALALIALTVPPNTDCQTGDRPPMKCHWTARAGIAVALPLAGIGALLFLSRHGETRRALAAIGLLLGVVTALLPTFLIGVCSHPGMPCNAVMKPTLVLAGIVTVGVSLAVLAWARDGKDKPA